MIIGSVRIEKSATGRKYPTQFCSSKNQDNPNPDQLQCSLQTIQKKNSRTIPVKEYWKEELYVFFHTIIKPPWRYTNQGTYFIWQERTKYIDSHIDSPKLENMRWYILKSNDLKNI